LLVGVPSKLTHIEAMFEHKGKMHEYDVVVSVSYMEIYREEVYDLFVDRETVSHILTAALVQLTPKET